MPQITLHRSFLFLLSWLASLCLTISAAAAPEATTTSALSLQDVVSVGLKRSPQIKKSEADLAAARERTRAARGRLLPTVNLKGTLTEEDSKLYRAYVDATQPIYSSAVFDGLGLRGLEEDIEAHKHEQATRLYVRDLAIAYYNVAEQTRLLAAAEENIATLRRHSQVINRYEKIGRARRTDKLQTQINLSTALIDISDLRSQLVASKERLREVLALDETPNINNLNPKIEALVGGLPAPSQVVAASLKRHPSIRIAELTVQKVESEKGVALNTDLPSLSLRGQWGYKNSVGDDLFATGSDYNALTLDLTVPIFSGLGSLATRREYEERKVSAIRDLELIKFNIEANIRSKLENLTTFHERWALAKQAAQEADEALGLANRDYARSLVSSLEVTNLQRTRYEADRLWVRTQFSYARVLIEFQELRGEDLTKLYAK